jgi:branched-subunit amino acid ABC-type transport system permease component
MSKNVGGIDRILRIVAGLVLIALAATGQVSAWGWLGVIVLATGLFSFCGAYTLFGFSTCPMPKDQEPTS